MERLFIHIPTGYGSREVASFCAQLDDQLALLKKDVQGITTEELEWQPRPGMNSVGMLLAHLAIVEVHWTQVGLQGLPDSDSTPVLGIGVWDDGMPAKPDGLHPAALAGKSLRDYEDLLDRGRAYVKETARGFTDADLESLRHRTQIGRASCRG